MATAMITMGVMVVLPASVEFVDADPNTLVATKAATTGEIGAIRSRADEPGYDGDARTLGMRVRVRCAERRSQHSNP